MAGRGPAPKRHNQRGTENWTTLEHLSKPVLTPLQGNHTALASAYWDSWREDPVTATWTAGEVVQALHLLELIDMDPVRYAGEIRIRLDDLALSAKGRRQARLLLPGEPVPVEPSAEPPDLRVLPEAK